MGSKVGAIKVAAGRLGVSVEEYTAHLESGLKWCHICKSWKPRASFNVDRSRGDGLSAKCQPCIRVPERKLTKGRASPFKGQQHTVDARQKMSEAAKKRVSNRTGKRHTEETRRKISEITRERTPRGEQHYAYSHGQSQRDREDRRSAEYKQWRDAVYARDGYACQHCGDDKGGNLQAHHIKPYAGFPDLRFVVDNGITLCRDCHERLHLKPIPTKADLRRRRKHTT